PAFFLLGDADGPDLCRFQHAACAANQGARLAPGDDFFGPRISAGCRCVWAGKLSAWALHPCDGVRNRRDGTRFYLRLRRTRIFRARGLCRHRCVRGRHTGLARHYGHARGPSCRTTGQRDFRVPDRDRMSADQRRLLHYDHARLRAHGLFHFWLAPYGGDDGLTVRLRSTFFGFPFLQNDRTFYYFVLLSLFVAYLLFRAIVYSRFGRVFRGARENPTRIATLGFDVFRFQRVGYV